MEGWLDKKGEKGIVKSFRRRYFRSNAGRLQYSEAPESPPLGAIPLSGVLGVEPADAAAR